VVAAFWHYSQPNDVIHNDPAVEQVNGTSVPQSFPNRTDTLPIESPMAVQGVPTSAPGTSDILHDDIFFELGRKRLTDEGRAALLRHAEFLKSRPDWGVLLLGYTDQQGSMSYNKQLGLARAEAVKRELITLGATETSIRTASLGEEGTLCIDQSDVCRRMNRRVHLEFRNVGHAHMAQPTAVIPDTSVSTESMQRIGPNEGAGDESPMIETGTDTLIPVADDIPAPAGL
jgi:peptidoglycan-associated lipoprotein